MESLSARKKILLMFAIAVTYFGTAQLGLLWVVDDAKVTPIWPAAGVGVASLFAFGWRMWPAVFGGAFLSAVLHLTVSQKLDYETSSFGAVMIALGTTLEALAIWYLAGKWKVRRGLFDNVVSIFKFVPITLLTCLVSSSIGAVAIATMGINDPQTEPITFITWWLAGGLSVLIFMPLLMSWWPIQPLKRDRWFELFAAYSVLLLICALVFGESNRLGIISLRPSFVLPVLLWMAFRFSNRELLSAVALFTMIAVYATTHHQGPFVSSSMIESFLSLQLFCAMIVITMLVLSTTVRQNIRYQHALRQTNEMLEMKVRERTNELEKKARILEAINRQLVIEARERQAAERRLNDLGARPLEEEAQES